MKKFLKNSSILMIGDLLTKLISVLYLIPLKNLNNDIVLMMTNLLIPFGFFIVFTTMGVNIILTNELVLAKTKEKTKSILVSTGIIMLILTLLSIVLMTFSSPLIMNTIELNKSYAQALIRGALYLNIGLFLFTMATYLRSIFMAKGDYKIISLTYIIEQLARVGGILIGSYYLFYLHEALIIKSINVFVISILGSMTLTCLIFIIYFFKKKYYLDFQGKYKIEKKTIKHILIGSLIFFLSGLYLTLFDQIDLFYISKQMANLGYSLEQINLIKTEYFTYSLKIVMIPITISTALISVMIKQIGEKDNKQEEFKIVIRATLIYSLIMMLGVNIFGGVVYNVLYNDSSTIIKIQALIIPFYILKNVLSGYIITNQGKFSSVIISSLIMIMMKIILDFILFDYFIYYGYIYSTIIAITTAIIILYFSNKKIIKLEKK